MTKAKPKAKLKPAACGCGPLPGILFPVNYDPMSLSVCVQRCDECHKYESDEDAAEALHAWLASNDLLKVSGYDPLTHCHWYSEVAHAGRILELKHADNLLPVENWVPRLLESIKGRLKHQARRSEVKRSAIVAVSLSPEGMKNYAVEARRKNPGHMFHTFKRIISAGGVSVAVGVLVQIAPEEP